ncbi:MAG: ABC transporter ATP-binding protein [Clostridia bacterium]|jgi:ATP-binding cassette subfamily B multidrug efflux pump|nr:ABC transporter ATP-binding protein [Clostridia bacterium]MCI8945172.1 ABC transporter ATP-binding protein [Clostridia bacterium]MCI9291261.1 ABC transporter ATP-binding protein [Clostridia bacterium]
MSNLYPYLKKYKKHLVLGPIFKLLEAIFELIVPYVMAKLIDEGINNANKTFIFEMGGILVLLSVVGLAAALFCQYVASRCSQGFGTELRNVLFYHINTLSMSKSDEYGVSSMVTRFNSDVNQVQLGVAMLIRLAIRAPFLVIGATVSAIILKPSMCWIFLVAAPLVALVLWLIMSKTLPVYTKNQKKLDRITAIAREDLNGMRVVRAFTEQEREQARFESSTDDYAKSVIAIGRVSALLNPLSFMIINLAIVALLYFGGNKINAGALTQGELIAFINYMMQISLALVVLANVMVLFSKSYASAKRVSELLATQSDVKDNDEEVSEVQDAPMISFKDVYFQYGSGSPALKGLSVDIFKGETVGIIGGTGSGKSTLVNLLPRFYDVSQGSLEIQGVDIKNYPLKQLRSKIGLVPQQAMLFSGSIRSNMLWRKADATEEEIEVALKTAQAYDFVMAKEKGLDSPVQQKGKNFSGGQRQRLSIARALVGNPQILILDDSMSALDFATDLALRRGLSENLPEDTVKIIISQRATSIKDASKIIVLDKGNVVGIGPHDELMRTCDIYQEIYSSQQKTAKELTEDAKNEY